MFTGNFYAILSISSLFLLILVFIGASIIISDVGVFNKSSYFSIVLVLLCILSLGVSVNKRDKLYAQEDLNISKSKYIEKYFTDDRHGNRRFYFVYELGEVEVGSNTYFKAD